MKRLNSLFTVAMLAVSVVVVSLAATSCSNDDDDNNGGGESSTNIVVGTWSGTGDLFLDDRLTLTFKKDGTGTYNMFIESETDNGTFSYEMFDKSTGIITIKYYDDGYGWETTRHNFHIEGTKMHVNEVGDPDFSWTLTKK